MSIKAIQTRYAGCHFRSRLEARWAVFFDSLGLEWEYEPQGYMVGPHEEHQIRYLPDFYLPDTQTWVEVKGSTDNLDFDLLAYAIDWGGGLPGTDESDGTTRGLLLLGPIPLPGPKKPSHPLLQHHEGGVANIMCFDENLGIVMAPSPDGYYFFDATTGGQAREPWSRYVRRNMNSEFRFNIQTGYALTRAYSAARSARFEHGEVPKR